MRHAPGPWILSIAMADVKNLPERFRPITVPHEVLGKRDCIRVSGAEIGPEIVNPNGGRADAGHERVTRGRADCLVAVSSFKENTALCEPIHVWGADFLFTVTTEQWLQVIDANE